MTHPQCCDSCIVCVCVCMCVAIAVAACSTISSIPDVDR
jgi:hypothetical protein